MAEPYIGEIKMVSFDYAPRGWALCAGQILQINQNQALYSLIGQRFGGDGRTTFALPDLRGRTPVHTGSYSNIGLAGGAETVSLSMDQIPAHSHAVLAANEPADSNAANHGTDMFAKPATINIYGDPANLVSFHEKAVTTAGGSDKVPHDNMQPSTVTNFIIALTGVYPPRN